MRKVIRTRETKRSALHKLLQCSENQIITGLSKLGLADRKMVMYVLKLKGKKEC